MHYRTLGRTGIKVSPFCLGAMMFGRIAIDTGAGLCVDVAPPAYVPPSIAQASLRRRPMAERAAA